MKRWTIVMACALAIGLVSAPVGVYADHHGQEELLATAAVVAMAAAMAAATVAAMAAAMATVAAPVEAMGWVRVRAHTKPLDLASLT